MQWIQPRIWRQMCSSLAHFAKNYRRAPLAASMLCALLLAGCQSDLYASLDERQANEIVATLLRHHISAARSPRRDNTFAVTVDESNFAEAMRILDESGLPRPSHPSMCEIFKKDGLVQAPEAMRAQMMCALSEELSKTISQMDGVLTARVHVVLPENDLMRQQTQPSSAGVFIRHQKSVPMDDFVPRIKMLVANGIAGLSYDKVSVILVPVDTPAMQDSQPEEMVQFLGMWLKKDSAALASWLFYGLFAAIAGLVSLLGYVLWRKTQKVYKLPATQEAKAP